uniref:Translocon-associated protein subunit alpha n=1 Tax=Lygus hesperus TaxID=30085 RepID=A0A0A9ZD42_LYGHE
MYDATIQNFSIVRHARVVYPHETVNIRYSFTPDRYIDSGEYNLVIGLFVNNGLTNATNLMTAFNATIYIDDVIGTDVWTVFTYVIIVGFLCGVIYSAAYCFGMHKHLHQVAHATYTFMLGHVRHQSKETGNTVHTNKIEVGTSGETYDPQFVSAEHLRYREKILK